MKYVLIPIIVSIALLGLLCCWGCNFNELDPDEVYEKDYSEIYPSNNSSYGVVNFLDPQATEADYLPNSIIVRSIGKDTAWVAAGVCGGTVEDSFEMMGDTYSNIRIPNGMTVNEALSFYSEHPAIRYAEPNYIYQPFFIPNDPMYSIEQWGPQMTNCPKAWEIEQGSDEIVYAVIDSGVDYHQEFRNRMIQGYDCVNYIPLAPFQSSDGMGHGSHVAGIGAAQGNDRRGMAGVAWNVKIMPLKVCDVGCPGYAITRGIRYAAENQVGEDGVHRKMVINMSLGGPFFSDANADAVSYALNKDVVIIAASGNSSKYERNYPAGYSGVVGIGCLQSRDEVVWFTSKGMSLDLVAPGTDIVSVAAKTFNGYVYMSGTSMASPFAAGYALLIRSANPDLTQWQVADIMMQTADPIEGSPAHRWNPVSGWGRINVGNGVECAANVRKYPNDPTRWTWIDEDGETHYLGQHFREDGKAGFRLGGVHVELRMNPSSIIDAPPNAPSVPIIKQDVMLLKELDDGSIVMYDVGRTSDGTSTPDFETGEGVLPAGDCYFHGIPEGKYIIKANIQGSNEISKDITVVPGEMLEIDIPVSMPEPVVNYTVSAFPPYNNKSLILGKKFDPEAPSACRPYLTIWKEEESSTDQLSLGGLIDSDLGSNGEYYYWPKARLLGPVGIRYLIQLQAIIQNGYNSRPDIDVGYYGMTVTNDNTAPFAYKIPDDWEGLPKYSIGKVNERYLWSDPEGAEWLTTEGEFYDAITKSWIDLNAKTATTPEYVRLGEVVFGYIHKDDVDFWILDLKN